MDDFDDMAEIIAEFIIESTEGLDQLDQDLLTLEQSPADTELATALFRVLHSIKGACGFLGFETLEQVSHRAENVLSALRDGVIHYTSEVADGLLATADTIRSILASISDSGAEGEPDVAALIEQLEALAAPNLAPASDPPVEHLSRIDAVIAAVTKPDNGAPPPTSRPVLESTIRVDVAVLDSLMNLVGELVLTRNQIVQMSQGSTDVRSMDAAQRLNLITSELQEGVMRTRMQPIGTVWGRLPRIVRDLSQQLGKTIQVEMEGRDTELDRTILEAISDPLVHMVRNSVDHGIEDAATRRSRGKPEEGLLFLSASHRAGKVHIELADDGGGIDPDMMRATAVRRGVVDETAAAELTDAEACMLIFAPGFSTAGQITNVSGRGVGMDVVRTNIERIGGSVEIDSTVGVGTNFYISIPLTLAIVQALTVRAGGHRYAIPQVSLMELLLLDDTSELTVEFVQDAPVLRHRADLLPIVDLHQLLGVEKVADTADEPRHIVVVQSDGTMFGLLVDAIEDTEEIVVKPLGRTVKNLGMYSGATIMGDGSVALILDAGGIAGMAGIVHAASAEIEQPVELPRELESLLLLDPGDDESAIAVRLAEVDRIEDIEPTAVERSPDGQVMQYQGRLLPLVSPLDLLQTDDGAANATDVRTGNDQLHVVVCTNGDSSVGLVVRRVLDVVNVPLLDRGESEDEFAVVDGRIVLIMSPDRARPDPTSTTATMGLAA